MNKKKIAILFAGIATLFCIAAIFSNIISQRSDAQLDNTRKAVPSAYKTIRRQGWQIPKASYTSKDKTFSLTMDGFPVRSRTLTPVNSVVDYEDYFVQSTNELTIAQSKMQIVGLSEYAAKGKVFAYAITYMPYQADGSSVSGLLEIKFLDNDGDGLFEERINSLKMPPLPDWVRATNKLSNL